jgi:hypothetical protein
MGLEASVAGASAPCIPLPCRETILRPLLLLKDRQDVDLLQADWYH